MRAAPALRGSENGSAGHSQGSSRTSRPPARRARMGWEAGNLKTCEPEVSPRR